MRLVALLERVFVRKALQHASGPDRARFASEERDTYHGTKELDQPPGRRLLTEPGCFGLEPVWCLVRDRCQVQAGEEPAFFIGRRLLQGASRRDFETGFASSIELNEQETDLTSQGARRTP